ncbi:hypothetical protein GCM10010211_55010 [Streptomyces albospinus]|uniref:Uncharacterized protein n=1 Tax=Streptomyces albospinus TaxID=285515 RepID=A0ABQ2VFP5_9ACTN|nr:hypothetical protein [Streptomyces albospinus]GGU82039.1 hypothetical protein GCM10010211_55010 [Streptomyces albospinus]
MTENVNIDRQQLMVEALQEYAACSDEQLDWILGLVRHRIGSARRMGVPVPAELASRVSRLSEKRSWPLDDPEQQA